MLIFQTHQKDLCTSKETCEHAKRPIYITRDLLKRPTKETYKRDLQNRPIKQTYKTDLRKRPTKETYKRDLQKRPSNETY